MRASDGDETAPKEQIIPDGIVGAVFHYGEPWKTTVADRPSAVQPRTFAISMMSRHSEIEPVGGRTGFISVRFFPWGAYHFFAEPRKVFPWAFLWTRGGVVRWKKVGFMPTDTDFFKESPREKIEDLLEM